MSAGVFEIPFLNQDGAVFRLNPAEDFVPSFQAKNPQAASASLQASRNKQEEDLESRQPSIPSDSPRLKASSMDPAPHVMSERKTPYDPMRKLGTGGHPNSMGQASLFAMWRPEVAEPPKKRKKKGKTASQNKDRKAADAKTREHSAKLLSAWVQGPGHQP